VSFLDELVKVTNRTRTENEAAAHLTTLSGVLDFFALGGALRGRPSEFARLFEAAYQEDPLTALRTLFYIRDVRGGQGERNLFRVGLRRLVDIDVATFEKNLHLVPEYGRWDDLLAINLPVAPEPVAATNAVFALIDQQLEQDMRNFEAGNSISLLAKWLPSENTSSKATVAKARQVIAALDISPREYRKILVTLRDYIHILERDMSANNWDNIEYAKLPSQAHRKHVKAFNRHSQERYQAYLASVNRGEAKINAGTIYTYELYDQIITSRNDDERNAINTLWENLPDYTEGRNALVVADVSGSMWGRPLSVSVSLALYFAERNTGPFNGYFMTFSGASDLVKVKGSNLHERMSNISQANWGMNTNLQAAFEKILQAGLAAGASAEDYPTTLYIISDMEFDMCVGKGNAGDYHRYAQVSPADETLFENARREYAEHGLTLPHVVFWNVNARNTHAPATKFDGGVTLISGLSQSTFRYAVERKSPLEVLHEVVNSERYQPLTLA